MLSRWDTDKERRGIARSPAPSAPCMHAERYPTCWPLQLTGAAIRWNPPPSASAMGPSPMTSPTLAHASGGAASVPAPFTRDADNTAPEGPSTLRDAPKNIEVVSRYLVSLS